MSEFTDSTVTFIIESLDGEPLSPDAVAEALKGVAKVRGWRGGDHLVAKVALVRMVEQVHSAARLVGIEPKDIP